MFYPYIEQAGYIWMMPIIFLSFCALAFCMERIWYWTVFYFRARGRNQIVKKILKYSTTREEMTNLCKGSMDPIMLVLEEFLENYNKNVSLEIAERKAIMLSETKIEESRHFLDLLSLIANISGTLGLMGTVVGISLSFKSLAMQDSKKMALSLSTALYTTVGGIFLFLISYLCLFFFQKLSDKLENNLENTIQNLKDLLEIKDQERKKKKKKKLLEQEKNNLKPEVKNGVDDEKKEKERK